MAREEVKECDLAFDATTAVELTTINLEKLQKKKTGLIFFFFQVAFSGCLTIIVISHEK